MNPDNTIHTERLFLREITASDTDFIVDARSDPSVYKYFNYPHKIKVEEHLTWFNSNYFHDSKRIDYIASMRSDFTPVGIYGIKLISKELFEVSYLTIPKYQGKGYAKEAVISIIEKGCQLWNCSTCIATVHKENTASMDFANRLGFIPDTTDNNFIVFTKSIVDSK
ncbi:MAG: GNAT family N-acetyltransferase [Agathobacter sp.]|nr:GNAT family N-acetyltransferase [Agathobacter sp.]